MIEKMPKPAFLGCLLTSLVIGPFFDFARGGAPLALPNVNREIFAALATDCTIFAAANGNDGNDGTKHADGSIHPKTLIGAAASTAPGSVVCLLGGRYELPYTFVPPYGGSSSSWITYKHYGDGDVLLVWTSGISFNINQCSNSYDGLHLIIANNVIVGEVDQSPNHKDVNGRHTDGNGIILDYDTDTAPPIITCPYPPGALVANNIVYGNGGQCIAANQVSNFWIVNNTCYKNGLDLSEEPSIGEFDSNNSTNGHFVNNISVAWQATHPAYVQAGTNSDIYYFKNLYFGSSCGFACSDATQWFSGDPLFVNAPYFDGTATTDGQYNTARPPSAGTPTDHALPQRCAGMVPTCGIVSGFGLSSGASRAYHAGIDPTTDSVLSARMSAHLKAEMQYYIYTDINGRTRTAGVNWDLGALAHKVD